MIAGFGPDCDFKDDKAFRHLTYPTNASTITTFFLPSRRVNVPMPAEATTYRIWLATRQQ